jgi:hypothetical protein
MGDVTAHRAEPTTGRTVSTVGWQAPTASKKVLVSYPLCTQFSRRFAKGL